MAIQPKSRSDLFKSAPWWKPQGFSQAKLTSPGGLGASRRKSNTFGWGATVISNQKKSLLHVGAQRLGWTDRSTATGFLSSADPNFTDEDFEFDLALDGCAARIGGFHSQGKA
jgi:hypothetical protein